MTIKIGDRVRYNEEHGSPDDELGTVVEPSAHEREVPVEIRANYVMVAWDDGTRFWEAPDTLVVLEDA